MRQMTVAKSAVRLVLPAHRPAVMVADVSKPNLRQPRTHRLDQGRGITCAAQQLLGLHGRGQQAGRVPWATLIGAASEVSAGARRTS